MKAFYGERITTTSSAILLLLTAGLSTITTSTSAFSLQPVASSEPFFPRSRWTECSQFQTRQSSATALFASKDKKSKGVYVRPSGAIERGSGFFVPGLEGSRVRLAFGAVLIILTLTNHVLNLLDSGVSLDNIIIASWTLQEKVAIVYSGLVLFQAAIEYGKETKVVVAGDSTPTTSKTSVPSLDSALSQTWSSTTTLSDKQRDKIQWASASYIALTAATQMMLLSKSPTDGAEVVYRLGQPSANDVQDGIQAGFQELDKSKTGRLALPGDSHPTALALISDESQRRTVLIQRIEDNVSGRSYCWLVSSDQLLAKFTKQDLRWLGQFAKYVQTE